MVEKIIFPYRNSGVNEKKTAEASKIVNPYKIIGKCI